MKLFGKKTQKRVEPPRLKQSERKKLDVNGKEYYLSIHEVSEAPMALIITLNDIQTKRPVMVLTKDFGDFVLGTDNYMQYSDAYLDVKSHPNVLTFLESRDICLWHGNEDYVPGQAPDEVNKTGYPLVRFDMEELSMYDPEGVVKYKANYDAERERLYHKYDRWKNAANIGVCYGGDEANDYNPNNL